LEKATGGISSASKTLLDAYAEIYFKAWKNAEGPYLMKLEYDCIQDMMASCVHGAGNELSSPP